MKDFIGEWVKVAVFWSTCCLIFGACGYGLRGCRDRDTRDSASLEQCAQSEQVCNAVAERMGIVVTIPPWQAMVLTPILDPR